MELNTIALIRLRFLPAQVYDIDKTIVYAEAQSIANTFTYTLLIPIRLFEHKRKIFMFQRVLKLEKMVYIFLSALAQS